MIFFEPPPERGDLALLMRSSSSSMKASMSLPGMELPFGGKRRGRDGTGNAAF